MQKFFMKYGAEANFKTQNSVSTNTYSKAPVLSHAEEGDAVSVTDTSVFPAFSGRSQVEKRETRGIVLLLCSNEEERAVLKQILDSDHYIVRSVEWNKLTASHFENVSAVLAVADASNPIVDSYCRKLRDSFPFIPIVFIDELHYNSEHGSTGQRLAEHRQLVMQYAADYMAMPFRHDSVLGALHHAMQVRALEREKMALLQYLGHPVLPAAVTGSSVAAQTLRRQIDAFGRLDTTILISGEKGTGKNTVAQLVHQASSRANQPFLIIPCDAFPSHVLEAELFGWMSGHLEETSYERIGKLQLLSEGTILLDNVECLPPFQQRKLLAFLQRQSNLASNVTQNSASQVRIIASTCGQLPYVCAQRKFLEELFYLFRSMTIAVPSLRERQEDLPELCNELMVRLARQFGVNQPILSTPAMQKLRCHTWPGNIHELEMVLYDAISKSRDEMISESDITIEPLLPVGNVNCDTPLGLAGLSMSDIERRAIIETIIACHGNRAKAAQKLGISEKTIYNKIKQFKLRGLI